MYIIQCILYSVYYTVYIIHNKQPQKMFKLTLYIRLTSSMKGLSCYVEILFSELIIIRHGFNPQSK